MFLGVALGAFGAHGLQAHFNENPRLGENFATAVRYHMIHALALFAIAWASTQWPGALMHWAGYLLIIGLFIFSGSLYILSLTGKTWLGAITPIGGVAFFGGLAMLSGCCLAWLTR